MTFSWHQEDVRHCPPLTAVRRDSDTPAMTVRNDDLLQAIDLALRNEWDAAHRLVQQHEADATASWIHAVLHKIEGDLGNSRYWYHRADKLEHVADEPRAELAAIKAELAGSPDA
jgi:hypothetical protein